MRSSHPMINTLRTLKGNSRMCVYLEPLWGIPNALYAPYATLFMLSLGVTNSQIGFITSLSLLVQVVASVLSGPLTDKFGRRITTFAVDMFCWTVPMAMYMLARNYMWFAVGAAINGLWRITSNSWVCLLVEDEDHEKLVHIFALTHICGIAAGFFAPIAGLFVGVFSLVPTVRCLYGFAGVMMALKFTLLFVYGTETEMGKTRMAETKNESLMRGIFGCKDVVLKLLRTPRTLLAIGMMTCYQVVSRIYNDFWGTIVRQRLGIADSSVAMFASAKAVVMMAMFFLIVPRIAHVRFKRPVLTGFLLLALCQLVLILPPVYPAAQLLVSVILEACAIATISPMLESLMIVHVDARERARITGMLYGVMLAVMTPFGIIAGQLSNRNPILPFLLNCAVIVAGMGLTLFFARRYAQKPEQA